MKIKKVTVFGTGNIGAGLAFHIAFNKVDVTVYDRNYSLLEEARTRFRELGSYYQKQFGASKEKIEAALANIAYSIDITEAAGNAQLIIEAVAEDLQVKKAFYKELQKTAPKNAFFVTTSKGLNPETLARTLGSSNKFLRLNFTGNKVLHNSVEIFSLSGTLKRVVQSVAEFFESIDIEVTLKHLEQHK